MTHKFVLSLLLFSLFLSLVRPVAAHGGVGTLQVSGASVGPYQLDIWTTPEILRPGEVLIAALILDQELPILDCQVTYLLRQNNTKEQLRFPATQATVATAFSHEAILQLTNPGIYLIEAEITAPDGTITIVSFEIQITEVSQFIKIFIHLLITVTFLAALWFAWEGLKRGGVFLRIYK